MKQVSIFLLVLFVGSANAQPSFVKDSLESYIQQGMRDWQIPGMAVLIVKDGQVVHRKGYGVSDVETKKAVDENTLFMIGSNTKAFTATALAMLEQEKKISLDDKVSKWIPYFKLRDENASKLVTVRDLLCHRIGFETFQGDFTYWASNLTREEVIRKMAVVEAPYSFRTKWGYCNAAFTTAGQVIPAVTGKPWEQYIKEKILLPLKMNRTLLLASEMKAATNAATPYTVIHGKLTKLNIPQIDNLAPAGTISSSVQDMTNWLLLQVEKGKFENQQVIPSEAIMATRTPQSIMGLDYRDKQNTHFYLYGLGFDLSDRAGRIVVAHTGGVDGFVSSVMIVPEEKLGIVILTNTDQNNFYQDLTREIRDAYLSLPYIGFSKRSLQRTKANELVEKRNVDSLKALTLVKQKPGVELKNYAGDYKNELYGDVSIKVEKNSLTIYFSHHPQLVGNLELLKENTFLCTYSVPTYGMREIPFQVKNGKVTGFTLRVADFIEFTPYEFTRK